MVFDKLQEKYKCMRINEFFCTVDFLELNHQLSGTQPGDISF